MIKITNLKKSYSEEKVLKGINLTLDNGLVIIQGSSGSGKSTLLNILGTLDTQYEGSVEIGNKELKELKEGEKNLFRRQHMGFIFQFHHLINDLTILDNILLPSKLGKEDKIEEAHELAKEFGIEHILNKQPVNTSGGERQRTALARALINNPNIIFADEPTGNLDNENSLKVAKLFKKISKDMGKLVIIATHDMIFTDFADQSFKIKDGLCLNNTTTDS